MTHGFGGSSVLPLRFYSSRSLNPSFSLSAASIALNWSLYFALIKDRSLLYIALCTAPYTVALPRKSSSLFHKKFSFSQFSVSKTDQSNFFSMFSFFTFSFIVKLSDRSNRTFYVLRSEQNIHRLYH